MSKEAQNNKPHSIVLYQIDNSNVCSFDYDKSSETTKTFYSFVQNKLHYAVTGQTAAELIYNRADATQPTMGLTTWGASPDGKILKRDVAVAKNYLNEKERFRQAESIL